MPVSIITSETSQANHPTRSGESSTWPAISPRRWPRCFRLVAWFDRHRHQPWLVSFGIARDLRLLDLTGTFLRAGRGIHEDSSAGQGTYAQNWSRAFYACYASIEGIRYPSSFTNRPVLALCERVLGSPPFPATPLVHRALSDALLIDPLRGACQDIGYNYL